MAGYGGLLISMFAALNTCRGRQEHVNMLGAYNEGTTGEEEEEEEEGEMPARREPVFSLPLSRRDRRELNEASNRF